MKVLNGEVDGVFGEWASCELLQMIIGEVSHVNRG